MMNVVLVEDEMLVLLGMKMCIQDSEHEMKVAAAFSTAEAALEYFERHTADVLVTDIRLAGMSGLELIEKVKPVHRHMLVVVLSCYEDFSYARRAYELGVEKYILKHELVEDELASQIYGMYIARKSQLAARGPFPDDAGMDFAGMDFERNGLLRTGCNYCIGLITMRGDIDDPQSAGREISYPMAQEIIQEILHRDNLGECFLRHNDELFCIFSLDDGLSAGQVSARLERFFENISKNLKNYFNKTAFMTVSRLFTDLRDVKGNFDRVKKYSGYMFYLNRSCIIWVEKQKTSSGSCPEMVFNPNNIFTERWMAEFEAYIGDYFEKRRESGVGADELKIQTVRYVNELTSFLSRHYDLDINEIFDEETRPSYFSINGFANADGLRGWLVKMVAEVGEYVRLHEKKETTISRILEYTERNYSTNLTLTDIADRFHMNPVYLCQLFKKKTGVTFITYINRLRIEKAKSLLLTTDFTAEQVSEQVGIRNNNYFFRLFKKMTGLTISQFRKGKEGREREP